MLFHSFFFLTLLNSYSYLFTRAITLHPPHSSKPAVVDFPIQRRNVPDPVLRDRLRRRQSDDTDQTVQVELDNLETLYFAEASLGTPKQDFFFHIDTGSSDLWVNSVDSDLCTSRSSLCSESGTYNSQKSSTYNFVSDDFEISYVDGSGASGDYVTDVFHFGNVEIEDLQFGVGHQSTSPESILGIGYMLNEVQVHLTNRDAYPNLPQLMVDQDLIQSNAYSLWLNDLDASTGNILFGGVDTEKFIGTLSTLPIIPTSGSYSEFFIALTAVGFDGEEGSIVEYDDNNFVPVLLDSGSTLMYLPDNLVASMYEAFDADYNSEQGAAVVDCDLANEDVSLEFTFSGATISVPMNELVLDVGTSGGSSVCFFGISPNEGSTSVLGDTFLRSAYVVYDLENNEISIAPTNFNATSSNVMEISSGTDSVPESTDVATAVGNLPDSSSELGTAVTFTPQIASGGSSLVKDVPLFGLQFSVVMVMSWLIFSL